MTARGEKNGKLKEGERENKEDLVKEEKPDEIRIPLTKFPLLRRQSSNVVICAFGRKLFAKIFEQL